MSFILACLFFGALCLGGEDEQSEFAKILTYNVLADPSQAKERLPCLFKILEESDAGIIALQEVAPWFLDELEKEAWIRAYHEWQVIKADFDEN